MKSVSFDFDDTLEHKYIQDYAKEIIEQRIDVHILTTRYEDITKYNFPTSHDDLFSIAKELGIPNDHIHFTNMLWKNEWLIANPEYNFIWHLDDSFKECVMINEYTNTQGIYHIIGGWIPKCNNLLK